jgi:uncharacterized protein YwqG/ankyrin repeat protein
MDAKLLFLKAIGENNRREVERLLAAGMSANAAVGPTYPLWVAIQRNCPEVISLLLSNGADVGRALTACTALLAVVPPKPEALKVLLEAGANPNGVGTPLFGFRQDGKFPLHCAVELASLECVKLLLHAGAAVNPVSPARETALDIAFRVNSAAIIERLRGGGGHRAIEIRIAHAAGRGDFEKARNLLSEARRVGPVVVSDHGQQATVQLRALVLSEGSTVARDEGPKAAQLVLEGADVNDVRSGPSALELAAAHERRGVLPVLLASVPLPSCALLFEAIQYCRPYSTAVLLGAGVDLQCTNEQGCTPLHYAAEYGGVALLETLLERGLSPTALDASGRSPLKVAEDRSPSDENRDVQDLLSWHIFRDAMPNAVEGLALDGLRVDPRGRPETLLAKVRNRAQLADACDGALSSCRDKIVEVARDSLLLEAEAPCDDCTIGLGASKLGGDPDLPRSVRWPRHGFHGRPLSFLAQIRLRDVAESSEIGTHFPSEGHLLFFYLADHDSGGQPWGFETNSSGPFATQPQDEDLAHAARVLWVEDSSVCVRTRPPRKSCANVMFEARRLSLVAGLTVPESLFAEVGDRVYREVVEWLRPPSRENYALHRMLGHPETEQGGPRCQHDSNFVLLLQLGSCDGFMWGGGGLLHFQIHRDDLASKNFERIFVEWDST